jgi:hypothetical protein
MSDLELLKSGQVRLVQSPKRKRKLQRRRERIRWSCEMSGWIWWPQ